MLTCKILLEENFEEYKFLIDEQNLSKKEFVTTDCKNHDTLALLEKLNFGRVSNLIKNPNRNLLFINYINEPSSRKETQTYLNAENENSILPTTFVMTSYSPPQKVTKLTWTECSIVNGLENIGGVSCYFNAVFQLLFHTKSFVEKLESFNDSSNEWFTIIKSLHEQLMRQITYCPRQEFSTILESDAMAAFKITNHKNMKGYDACQGRNRFFLKLHFFK